MIILTTFSAQCYLPFPGSRLIFHCFQETSLLGHSARTAHASTKNYAIWIRIYILVQREESVTDCLIFRVDTTKVAALHAYAGLTCRPIVLSLVRGIQRPRRLDTTTPFPRQPLFRYNTMSFGYSVGDFLALYNLVNTVRKQFVEAPDQFRAISDE